MNFNKSINNIDHLLEISRDESVLIGEGVNSSLNLTKNPVHRSTPNINNLNTRIIRSADNSKIDKSTLNSKDINYLEKEDLEEGKYFNFF